MMTTHDQKVSRVVKHRVSAKNELPTHQSMGNCMISLSVWLDILYVTYSIFNHLKTWSPRMIITIYRLILPSNFLVTNWRFLSPSENLSSSKILVTIWKSRHHPKLVSPSTFEKSPFETNSHHLNSKSPFDFIVIICLTIWDLTKFAPATQTIWLICMTDSIRLMYNW